MGLVKVGFVLSRPSEARMGHPFLVVGEGREKQPQVPVRLRSFATAGDLRSGQAFDSAEKRFAQDDMALG